MTDFEDYLLSAIFFLALCAVFFFWKMSKKKKSSSGQQKFVHEVLELARAQFETLNIKMQTKGGSRPGLSAIIHSMDKTGILLQVADFVPEEWNGKPVDVFFRIVRDEMPISYAFSSKILKMKADYEISSLLLALPENLRVEKKRHFIRVQPHKNDVRILGVWQMQPGKALPRTAAELGEPITHYQPEARDPQVQLENISGAGIALRISADSAGNFPIDLSLGNQLICLVVYAMPNMDARQIAFWCTAEIMNVRHELAKNPSAIVGLEFTNWAVLEDEGAEIHWAHSSPSRGAKPILQWVDQINKSNRGTTR